MRERAGAHDPGRVIRDLAVMLADGGEALSDLGSVREQAPLFGKVASDSTAYRAIDQIAADPELAQALAGAGPGLVPAPGSWASPPSGRPSILTRP